MRRQVPGGRVRRGRLEDAPRLYEIRRLAILGIPPTVISRELAESWADVRPPSWMPEVLASQNVRVFESDDVVAGWISTTDDEVDGLYVDPPFSRRGIGSRLLDVVEAELARAGWSEVRLEASPNAHNFYRKRGYLPLGPPDQYGALPVVKPLVAG